MRKITVGGTTLTLRNGVWRGDPFLAQLANTIMKGARRGLSPADGDPIAIGFYAVVREMKPDSVVDKPEPVAKRETVY